MKNVLLGLGLGVAGLVATGCGEIHYHYYGEGSGVEKPVNPGFNETASAVLSCLNADRRGKPPEVAVDAVRVCVNKVLEERCNMPPAVDLKAFCTDASFHGGTTVAGNVQAGGGTLCALSGEETYTCEGHLVDSEDDTVVDAGQASCEPFKAGRSIQAMIRDVCRNYVIEFLEG